MNSSKEIFTIGHSNHSPQTFLKLLRDARIQVLVDTRSNPGSRWAPHANPGTLDAILAHEGIRYVYLGDSLGGRPKDPECYDPVTHKPDYQVIKQQAFFQDGIQRLESEMEKSRVCIMCSEEDPTSCHRSLLIGQALQERGNKVVHIRGDGLFQPHELIKRPRSRKSRAASQLPFDI